MRLLNLSGRAFFDRPENAVLGFRYSQLRRVEFYVEFLAHIVPLQWGPAFAVTSSGLRQEVSDALLADLERTIADEITEVQAIYPALGSRLTE